MSMVGVTVARLPGLLQQQTEQGAHEYELSLPSPLCHGVWECAVSSLILCTLESIVAKKMFLDQAPAHLRQVVRRLSVGAVFEGNQ